MENIAHTPIEQACQIVGGQAALANLLHVTPAAVNQWVKGLRPIPAIHCPSIERATSGQVRCEELLPDVDWAYLRTSSQTESTRPTEERRKNPQTEQQERETENAVMRVNPNNKIAK